MISYLRFLCTLMIINLIVMSVGFYWNVNYGSDISVDIYEKMRQTADMHKQEMSMLLRQIREHREKDIVAERLMYSEESISVRKRNQHSLDEIEKMTDEIIANQKVIISGQETIIGNQKKIISRKCL